MIMIKKGYDYVNKENFINNLKHSSYI